MKYPDQYAIIVGAFVWNLYSTHGLPLDVIGELAQANGREIDIDGFKELQGKEKVSLKALLFLSVAESFQGC